MVFVNNRSQHTKCAACTPKHTLFSIKCSYKMIFARR